MTTRDAEIGAAVAAERGELSQQWVADKMRERGWKWAQATVWNVEKGERPLRLAEAEDLANILSTDIRRLTARPFELDAVQRLEDGVAQMQRVSERFEHAIESLELAQAHLKQALLHFDHPTDEWPREGLFWEAAELAKRAQAMLSWTSEGIVKKIEKAKHGEYSEEA